MTHIVHLALADGRGHLIRAHRLRTLLGAAGLTVEIATTSAAGAEFLAALGTPAWVLPGGLRMVFDGRHAMDVAALNAGLLRYLATGLGRDVAVLRRKRADYYINDSFHPALLTGDLGNVVLLHGDTMEQAFLAHLDGTPLERPYRALASARIGRAMARVCHSFAPEGEPAGAIVLPPLLEPLRRSEGEVRQRIGAAGGVPIACVYLNPHFRDPEIAAALEQALASRFHLHAVGEGYRARPGWHPTDGELHEVIARASLFVSGAGMAAIAEARRACVPMLVLSGDQPEQAQNLARAERVLGPGALARVAVGSGDRQALASAIDRALGVLAIRPRPRPARIAPSPERLWRDTFVALFDRPLTRTGETPWKTASRSSSRPTTFAAARPAERLARSRASSSTSGPRMTRSPV